MHIGHVPRIEFEPNMERLYLAIGEFDCNFELGPRKRDMTISLQVKGPEHAHELAKALGDAAEQIGRHSAPQHAGRE